MANPEKRFVHVSISGDTSEEELGNVRDVVESALREMDTDHGGVLIVSGGRMHMTDGEYDELAQRVAEHMEGNE